jgi:hypothetical protein
VEAVRATVVLSAGSIVSAIKDLLNYATNDLCLPLVSPIYASRSMASYRLPLLRLRRVRKYEENAARDLIWIVRLRDE